jgi:FkbM family methyltransferase
MQQLINTIFKVLTSNRRVAQKFVFTLLNSGKLPSLIDASSVLTAYRQALVQDVFEYPSIVNHGYLHIERAIKVLESRGLGENQIIFDVGAAGGETCVLFSKAFPLAQVVGFEPIASTYKKAIAATQQQRNITIHHTALGKEKGSAEINVMSRITASSLLPSHEDAAFNGQKYFEVQEREKIIINVLDDFLKTGDRVALIKMDVQGYELEVLKGAVSTLKNTHFILLELQNHEIYVGAPKYFDLDSHLRSANFELFDIIPSIREKGQIKEFDALYINKALDR